MNAEHSLTGEFAVYPGHPVMVALAIIESFPSLEAALKTSEHGWEEAVGSNEVPGSGGCARLGCDLLRRLHFDEWEFTVVLQWADECWGRVDGMSKALPDSSYGKRYREGLEQARRFQHLLAERASFWAPMRVGESWLDTQKNEWRVEKVEVKPEIGIHVAVRRQSDQRRKKVWAIPRGWKKKES